MRSAMAKYSSTQPTPSFTWPSRSPTPIEVDDQAPIPLIVGIALALFIGFVIIVCCICRRRSLSGSSSSSNNQDSNAAYQRAPTGDGAPTGGGFNTGVGGNSYPMAPVKSMYPSTQGPQSVTGQTGPGGMNMNQHQQGPPPYPSLPPNAYTPPCPIGYAPLPSYMPTAQSSHASSASGPSSDHGPSGFSSSPPAPAPAPTGMMATGNNDQSSVTVGGLAPQTRPAGSEMGTEGVDGSVTGSGMGTLGHHHQGSGYGNQGQGGYGSQGQGGYGSQGQGGYGMQGGQGQGMVHPGFQASVMSQRALMGMGGGGQSSAYSSTPQGQEKSGGMAQPQGAYPPTMHPTAMDYVPGGGFIPRVGSPMPPAGTTVTELDQL